MGFKFFHLPEHRVFDYPARYYNKDLQKFDDINAEAKAKAEGQQYVPGSIVSKGFRKDFHKELKRSDGSYGKGKRYILIILIAVILVALLYFTKALHLLFQAYQNVH